MTLPGPRTVLAFLLLLAVALVSTYLLSSLREDEDKPKRPELSLAYYLDNAELTGTGPDGNILFQVTTKRAAQARDEDRIRLREVRMVYGPPTALPWELEADRGYIPTDASVIELHGNVVAVSVETGRQPMILRTERLDIEPDTRNAMTTEDVTLEFEGRQIDATGMQANFETNSLKLLSNVNGRFLPE